MTLAPYHHLSERRLLVHSDMTIRPAIILLALVDGCSTSAFLHLRSFSHRTPLPASTLCRWQATDHQDGENPNADQTTGNVFFEKETFSDIKRSNWNGAGSPRPELSPEQIPALLMGALRMNDLPTKDAGLCSVWEFAGDTTRHIFVNNRTDFIGSAHETADTMATSFYGVAMKGKEWSMETPLNLVGGKDGWIATQVMKTTSWDGRIRRWQWELRKHRRPPNLGAWYVESIGSSDRMGNFEADD